MVVATVALRGPLRATTNRSRTRAAASILPAVSQQQPRLVALGDLLLDVVVTPRGVIERGTDVPGELVFRRGGSAANTAAAFVRSGGEASLVTCLGDDFWAGRLLASLRSDDVRVHAVRRAGGSGRLAALVDGHGERSFVTQRGIADQLHPEDVRSSWLRGADVLHVPAYSLFSEPIGSAALRAADLARPMGLLVSSDLSSVAPLRAFGVRRSRSRLAEVAPDVLFANRDEAAAMLRQAGRRAWAGLLRLASLVVVTDGIWGCRVLWRGLDDAPMRQLDVAAKRVGRVDSTGAGDAFAAGFMHSLVSSGGRDVLSRDRALRRAAMAGHAAAAAALRRGRPELRLG